MERRQLKPAVRTDKKKKKSEGKWMVHKFLHLLYYPTVIISRRNFPAANRNSIFSFFFFFFKGHGRRRRRVDEPPLLPPPRPDWCIIESFGSLLHSFFFLLVFVDNLFINMFQHTLISPLPLPLLSLSILSTSSIYSR